MGWPRWRCLSYDRQNTMPSLIPFIIGALSGTGNASAFVLASSFRDDLSRPDGGRLARRFGVSDVPLMNVVRAHR